MTAAPLPADPARPARRFPTRFREAEERSRRLGVPLRVLARTGETDEALMARLGDGMMERDEVAARLAEAIRMRAGEPGRVTLAQFRTALHEGVDAVPDPPPALVAFFDHVTATPDWVDWDLVDEGARVFTRLGQNAADVLVQLSLIGGYRFGGPTDLLVATGGLTGDATRRRLAETQKWTVSVAEVGALRPGEEAWRLTLHVRLMHALVNAAFEPRWDSDRWGLPINMTDQAATLGLFDGVPMIGCRAMGVVIGRRDSRALMHLWKYVGWLMGVDEEFLTDSERERHRINHHLLLAQADISEAGPQLAQAILAAQTERRYRGWPGPLQALRGRYERERLLSMLTVFLGPRSMVELGLPLRPPWAHAYIVPLNTLRYRVLGRTAWGRRCLERWGRRVRDGLLASYFLDEAEDVGRLPV